MKILAEGKDAVLAHLEQESVQIAGKPGNYALMQDDAGGLIAFIAGRSFIGTGSYTLDGNRFVVVNGLVVGMQKKAET